MCDPVGVTRHSSKFKVEQRPCRGLTNAAVESSNLPNKQKPPLTDGGFQDKKLERIYTHLGSLGTIFMIAATQIKKNVRKYSPLTSCQSLKEGYM